MDIGCWLRSLGLEKYEAARQDAARDMPNTNDILRSTSVRVLREQKYCIIRKL
jgi:hypothetical protein